MNFHFESGFSLNLRVKCQSFRNSFSRKNFSIVNYEIIQSLMTTCQNLVLGEEFGEQGGSNYKRAVTTSQVIMPTSHHLVGNHAHLCNTADYRNHAHLATPVTTSQVGSLMLTFHPLISKK
jgi:hypothetical protein